MHPLQTQIETLIHQSGAESVAVAFHDLETGQEVLLDADKPFHPASTFKTCVMMELYRQASLGAFTLDTPIRITNEFTSIADGSPFTIGIEADSEPSLHHRLGEWETLREINRLMIVRSGNLATNLLVELLGAADITAYMRELGAPDLQVLRGVEDSRAFALGLNNVATARGLMQILRQLAEGNVVSPEASQEMIGVLLGQQHKDGIPPGLPPGFAVAHKTGWIPRIHHDSAIVFPPDRGPFVLVVLTRGMEDKAESTRLMADIARVVVESRA